MKRITIEEAWGRHCLMAMAAVRYCLGRRTYIVSDCKEWLINTWPIMPEDIKATIQRDIEEAFKRDDEDRENGREHKTLGHDCDRRSWENVRKLWKP